MFDIPPDTPYLWYWLGAAGLLGLLIGVLLGRLGTGRARRQGAHLQSALDEALESRRTAEEATQEAGALATGLQEELDDARTSLADSEREIDALRADLDGAQTRIVQLEAEVASGGAGDDEEAERVRTALAAAEERAESLRAAISAARVDADARESAARTEAEEAAAGRISALEAELAELCATPDQDDEAAETIGRLRERLAEAEQQLEASAPATEADGAREHVIRELQAKVDALTDVEDRLLAREAELGELRRTQAAVVAAKDGEIRGLRQRLEARERAAEEPPKPDAAVVAELAANRSELAATQERAEHWEREAASLRTRLAATAEAPEPVDTPQAGSVPEPQPSGAEDDPRFAPATETAIDAPPSRPEGTGLEGALDELRDALADKETRIAYLADRVARLEAQFGAPARRSEEPVREAAPVPKLTPNPEPNPEPQPEPQPEPDDLTAIWGIGPAIEEKLNRLGIYSYDQVARLTPADMDAIGGHLGQFLDRIEADDWMGQARRLLEARGGTVSGLPLALDIPEIPDDLKQIRGIGPAIEKTLHSLGITTLRHIAGWTAEDVEAIGEQLVVFQGRIEREGWVAQARRLIAES